MGLGKINLSKRFTLLVKFFYNVTKPRHFALAATGETKMTKLIRLEVKNDDVLGLCLIAFYDNGHTNCWGHGLTQSGAKRMMTVYAKSNDLKKSKDGLTASF